MSCRFSIVCQERWDELTPIEGTSKVRFCGECQTQVHLVRTEEEFQEHAQDGHCVAWFPPRPPGEEWVGPLLGVPIGKG